MSLQRSELAAAAAGAPVELGAAIKIGVRLPVEKRRKSLARVACKPQRQHKALARAHALQPVPVLGAGREQEQAAGARLDNDVFGVAAAAAGAAAGE